MGAAASSLFRFLGFSNDSSATTEDQDDSGYDDGVQFGAMSVAQEERKCERKEGLVGHLLEDSQELARRLREWEAKVRQQVDPAQLDQLVNLLTTIRSGQNEAISAMEQLKLLICNGSFNEDIVADFQEMLGFNEANNLTPKAEALPERASVKRSPKESAPGPSRTISTGYVVASNSVVSAHGVVSIGSAGEGKRPGEVLCRCGVSCANMRAHLRHVVCATTSGMFKCRFCRKGFHFYGYLRQHEYQSHKPLYDADPRPSGEIGCRRCAQLFGNRVDLIRHCKTHHSKTQSRADAESDSEDDDSVQQQISSTTGNYKRKMSPSINTVSPKRQHTNETSDGDELEDQEELEETSSETVDEGMEDEAGVQCERISSTGYFFCY